MERAVIHQLPGLDIQKFIMAILIVAGHTRFMEEVPFVRELLGHIEGVAIPTFFTISAFLFYLKIDGQDSYHAKTIFLHTIKRLLIFYCIWWIITLPVNYYTFFSVANINEIIYAILLRSTNGIAWFVKAVIINDVLLFFFRSGKKFIFLTVLSFCVYFVLSLYPGLSQFKAQYIPYYSFYYHTIFFSLGAILAKSFNNLYDISPTSRYFCIFSFILLLGVSFINGWGNIVARFFYPTVLIPLSLTANIQNHTLCKEMRISSIIIYMSHISILYLYQLFVQHMKLPCFEYSIVRFSIVIVCCLIVSWLIIVFEKKESFSFLRYLH